MDGEDLREGRGGRGNRSITVLLFLHFQLCMSYLSSLMCLTFGTCIWCALSAHAAAHVVGRISCVTCCCRLATTVRIYYLCGVTCMILVLLDVCFMYFTLPGKQFYTNNHVLTHF